MLETLSGWLHGMLDWVESFAYTPHGGTALFAIAFAESSFFPIPPDVLLIPLCLANPSQAFWFAFLCSAGSVLGGIAGYAIGFWGGRPLVHRIFAEEKVRAVERYYDRYNAWATGIAGLTPIPYKLFTISGGACAINFKVFLLASVVSRSLRFFAVAGLIWYFGTPIQAFLDKYLEILFLAFAVLLVGGFWLFGRAARRAGRTGPADPVDPTEPVPGVDPGEEGRA